MTQVAPGAQPIAATRPFPYRVRAWWGDRPVADSTAALRLEVAGDAPILCFPADDVELSVFRHDTASVTCPVKGVVEQWSTDRLDPGAGAASTGTGASWGESPVADATDGSGVLWAFTDPPEPLAALAGRVAFDHDRVRVEVVDAVAGTPERDVTTKWFPTWGDAADLLEVMDVRPIGEHRYVTVIRDDHRRPVVEASQMLGQAIVAAGRCAPGRRVVSSHLVALRAADARAPLELQLHPAGEGRTFTTFTVDVTQGDRRCAVGMLLLDVTAGDVIAHAAAPPEVAGPYDSVPHDMGVTGRDLRVVDAAYTDDPDAPVGPPVLDAWVRFRELPDDPPLHAGLLAQFTGHMSIAAALRPHAGIGQRDAHRTFSTAVNAISLSLHADIRADRWLLYHHLSTFAGDGMTHSECRVHDEAGRLLASFSVDGMVRPFARVDAARDDRTAL
jgi:acyl-CoA thioesterase/uncharacterized protein (DUF427 family)